jgi:hypothetical protein
MVTIYGNGTEISLRALMNNVQIYNKVEIKNKIIILVTGTTIEPHDSNWKECANTWIPELKKLGYNVKVAIGNPELEHYYKDDGDIIWFKAEDTKRGLYDKSIKLPIDWILSETNYDFYFRIDSDSFVEPKRFDNMMENVLGNFPNLEYFGCCHPANKTNPFDSFQYYACRYANFASGCAYFVSRKSMKVAQQKMRIDEPVDYEIDDWVLGRAMWENGVTLLHDSRILFESPYKQLSDDPGNMGLPYIGDPNSHLAIQHYLNGHMEEAMVSLGYRN